MQDPVTTFIGPDVTIGSGTIIHPCVFIEGQSSIGEGTEIHVVSGGPAPPDQIAALIPIVTGAGGVFGNVLVESKIGNALSQSLTAMGMPLIVVVGRGLADGDYRHP